MSLLLNAQQITFQRNGADVFLPVDVQLAQGQAIVVRGDNGAGKTTLLRVLAGILTPSAGSLEFQTDPLFLGHQPAVKADLSCRENLHYEQQLGASGTSIAAAMIQVGLAGMGARPARSLSAGQKKRLGLARLLVRQSSIWLLDEPYASLDTLGCERVDQLINQHLAANGGVILSTHQQLPKLDHAVSDLQIERAEHELELESDVGSLQHA